MGERVGQGGSLAGAAQGNRGLGSSISGADVDESKSALSNSFQRESPSFARPPFTTSFSFLSPSLILESSLPSRVAVPPPQSPRYIILLRHATARAALSHPLGSWHEPYFSRLLGVAPSPVPVLLAQESWHARAHVGMSRHWSSLLFAPEESVPQKSPTASFVLLVNPRS
jgi:hypothetical protein